MNVSPGMRVSKTVFDLPKNQNLVKNKNNILTKKYYAYFY